MPVKTLLLFIAVILPVVLHAQTAKDLMGEWKFYMSLPDGTVLNETTRNKFSDWMVDEDREDKERLGQKYTEADSVKTATDALEGLDLLRSLTLTFQPNNVCVGKMVLEGKPEEKYGTYKYQPDTRVAEVIDDEGKIVFSFKLKKDGTDIHLYFKDDPLPMPGGKAYFTKG